MNNGTIRLSIIAVLLTLGLSSPSAHAQTYVENTLYSFQGIQGDITDGANPASSLIDLNGSLYGTTKNGGPGNVGVTFTIDEKTFHYYYFDTCSTQTGGVPESGLLNVNGVLYGTASRYGANNHGTIFGVNPTSGQTGYAYSFAGNSSGQNDGATPVGGLINLNGTLYGTAALDGAYGCGTVYSFDPSTNQETTVYSFGASSSDAKTPQADLLAVNGIFYGTTFEGGTDNFGAVFSLDPATQKETVLHSFSDQPDGRTPESALILVNGKLFGTTVFGGANNYGCVFSVDPTTGAEAVVYSFSGQPDGAAPQSSLILVNGKLFGTTTEGGGDNDGTVFSVDPTTGAETTVYSFTDTNGDGQYPVGGLVAVNGTLYGTTENGGVYGDGTVFSLTPVSPPTAVNDKYLLKYATPYAVPAAKGVLANDNAGGGTLTAALVSLVSHGTLTFNTDGSFLYTPATGFVGTDSFTYQAVNAAGHSSTATVSLIVQAVVPVAHNDAYAPTYNKAYAVKAPGVLANDFNGDNGTMTAALVTGPSHGTLTFNSDGSFLYASTLGFAGTDTFTYQAIDPIGTSNTATVTLTIAPINPIAYNDTYAPKYATAYAVKAPGVLGNDDTGGTTPLTAALVSSVAHGTLTFNSDGSFTYTPAAGFVGSDTFTYKNSTSAGTSNTATVTLNVTAVLPVAHNDAYTVSHNKTFAVKAPGVLANDYAGDSGSFTASLVSTTSHGILTFNTDGSFNYTPATGFTGTDTFTYQAKNAVGTSNTATVTLTVQ